MSGACGDGLTSYSCFRKQLCGGGREEARRRDFRLIFLLFFSHYLILFFSLFRSSFYLVDGMWTY